MEKDPHTKNIKKADPVAKYQQYRSSWQQYRPPGEKQHKSIRWGIREQMLYHDQVVDKVCYLSIVTDSRPVTVAYPE